MGSITNDYFTLQSNDTKYNKLFQFISWLNFPEEHHILSPDIWSKTFTDWFKKYSDGIASYIYFISCTNLFTFFILKPCNTQNGQRTKFSVSQTCSQPYFILYFKLSKTTLDFISELINLKYSFNMPFKLTLTTITMGTSFQFHNSVQLNILPTLSSMILLWNWIQKAPL